MRTINFTTIYYNSLTKLATLGALIPIITLGALIMPLRPAYAASKPTRPLNIVVTIAPFYNLIAAISGELNQIKLLVPINTSMHGYNLKPSDLTALRQADLIFWGGEQIETFLAKPIKHIPKTQQIVAFTDVPNMVLLPTRSSANWEEPHHHEHGKEQGHVHNEEPVNHAHGVEQEPGHNHEHLHTHGMYDPHIWLSLANAKTMSIIIADTLAKIDPEYATTYQNNAKQFQTKLAALDQSLQQKFTGISSAPYLVFHDAYQYLELDYHLNPIGAITLQPESPVSAQRLQKIRQQIKDNKVQCIFSEPQFSPKIVELLLANNTVKHGILDPLGQTADLGVDGYIVLLTKLADNLRACLE